MKRTLLIAALLLIQIGAFAQDTSWTKSMSKIYGSKVEKHQQDEIAAQSESRMLCRFIGFKSFYEQGISDYLQSHEYKWGLYRYKGTESIYNVYPQFRRPYFIGTLNGTIQYACFSVFILLAAGCFICDRRSIKAGHHCCKALLRRLNLF
jgi:hypothetical protein